ncbi:unnamed protein product [Vicia faba]|uniref:Uncharacterized protein n=1 Tax=Vicia faba TaxID=3906 RepID=A0AAV1A824_VICFA|nr:unnamed protein product [Vicia faba]
MRAKCQYNETDVRQFLLRGIPTCSPLSDLSFHSASFSGLGLAIDSPSGSDMTFAIYDGSGVIEASSSHSAGELESSNPNVAVFLGSIVLVVLLAVMLASRIE